MMWRWQAVVGTESSVYSGWINLTGSGTEWSENHYVEPELFGALQQSDQVRKFFSFARYWTASTERTPDGYIVTLRDLRFDLRMVVTINTDLQVQSTDVKWF